MLVPPPRKHLAGFSESASGKGTTSTSNSRADTAADAGSNHATDAAANVNNAAATTSDVDQNEYELSVIPQLDGNASFDSVSSSNSYNQIPVHTSDTRNLSLMLLDMALKIFKPLRDQINYYKHCTYPNFVTSTPKVFTTNGRSL